MKNNTHSRKGSDEMYQDFETIGRWTEDLKACGTLDPALYDTYGVKRGLRDKNGKGVVAGLTGISQVQGKKVFNGESITGAIPYLIWCGETAPSGTAWRRNVRISCCLAVCQIDSS